MTIARRLARPLLASIFVSGGIETLRHPGPSAAKAGDVPGRLGDALPIDLPDDPEQLVKLDAAAKVVGGLMLASGGRLARLGALVCAASLVPTTIAGHRFWEAADPDERARQQVQFCKNASILGGLLIAALDSGPRPSVPWRAKRGVAAVHDKATEAATAVHDRAAELLPT